MASLGSFGQALVRGPEGNVLTGDEFTLCGHKIRLRHPSQVSELPLIAMMGQSDLDDMSPEGFRALLSFFDGVLHPDDRPMFMKICVENGVKGEQLSQLLEVVVPALYQESPTNESSGSQPGQPSIAQSSPVDSYSPATVGQGATALAASLSRPQAPQHLVTQATTLPTQVETPKFAMAGISRPSAPGPRRDPHFGTLMEPVDDVVDLLRTGPGPS